MRILLILLILRQPVNAAENRTEIMVDFRVNVVRIDPGFSDNAERVSEIVSFLQKIGSDSTVTLRSVAFCGAASPEGSDRWNRWLAAHRLGALETLVRSQIDIPDSIITRNDSYIPWDYLRDRVAESNLAYKDTVLAIIDRAPELARDPDSGKPVDRRIVSLKKLENRKVWRELFRLYFAKMRNAAAVIVTFSEDRDTIKILPPRLVHS